MRNKDIIDYLCSLDGESKDSWYNIGIKFGIEAPDSERAKVDEAYRVKAIGTKTQDIWRNYVSKKNSLVPVKEVYKAGKLLFETFKKVPEELEYDKKDFEIQSITTNPNGGAWARFTKKEKPLDKAHIDSLLELLKKDLVLQPIDYKVSLQKVKPDSKAKGLFVYGADKHIGALTKENSIYKNKYNKEVIKERIINQTIYEIDEVFETYGQLEDLFIMDLGDALDGYNQQTTRKLQERSTSFLPQQYNNREQHDIYVEVHKELFDYIMAKQYAQNVFFIATSNSNHGGDFEYSAMKTLEMYLNIKYPSIKTFVTDKFIDHFVYGEHCIIFTHGKDTEDMKSGFPVFLNDKSEIYILDYIRNNYLEDYYITFVSADLHQSSEFYTKLFRYKKVLSQYGSSKWIHTNFGSTHAGLSCELFYKYSNKILKSDRIFVEGNLSNTGINICKS